MEIVIGHVNADFDSLAAIVAARKVYTRSELVFLGSQKRNVREFVSLHKEYLQFLNVKQLEKEEIDSLIVVDTKIAERLGEIQDVAYLPKIKIHIYDHHPATGDDIKAQRDFSELTGATTTILVNRIKEREIKLSPFEATLFALGIHEDTGSLTYPATTAEDALAVAYLMKNGAKIEVLNYFLNQPLDADQRKLIKQLFKTAEFFDMGGLTVLIASSEVGKYIDGAAVLAHKLEDLENTDIVVVLLKMEDRIHIIGRSTSEDVHMGEILTAFN